MQLPADTLDQTNISGDRLGVDCAMAAGSSMEAGKASCERVLFAEKAEVMSLLINMADPDSDVLGEHLAMVCGVAG